MKITALVENTSVPGLPVEHGLSLYIETTRHTILFDSGQGTLFAENAERLGKDLAKVDLMVLSHGHYDHGGGLEAFFKCNSTAPVYLSRHAFGAYYNGAGKYIGLLPHLQHHPRLIPVADRQELASGVTVECCLDREAKYPVEPYGLQVLKDGSFVPEEFAHELYLTVEEDQKICFSGCAHRGVENILHWLTPDILIGGFHFKQLQPGDLRLEQAAQSLQEIPCEYYTCHCTGQAQYDYLKERLGSKLNYLSTGDVLQLSNR